MPTSAIPQNRNTNHYRQKPLLPTDKEQSEREQSEREQSERNQSCSFASDTYTSQPTTHSVFHPA